MTERKLGIIVYGASGYTGRLVAEYLFKTYGAKGEFTWGMAGRNMDKLRSVQHEMGISGEVPLIAADASDPDDVKDLARRASVIITTVGPYQLYGNELVKACAEEGTDYVDLCGEPAWMHHKINELQGTAEKSGARIVFSCGFDSIPFDLGVFFMEKVARERHGKPMPRAKGRVRGMNGSFSGGTVASLRATMEAVGKDPSQIQLLMDPFSLSDGYRGPDQPDDSAPKYDETLNSWVAPFIMATINSKNIHRSNKLLGHSYGEDFVYDEMMLTGAGEAGEAMAKAIAEDKSFEQNKLKPGEGPSKEEREAGNYDILVVGEDGEGNQVRVSVKGDRDPGYGSTSKMIAESAVCLLKNPNAASGGVWTTAPAMGDLLIERLQEKAGLTFTVEA